MIVDSVFKWDASGAITQSFAISRVPTGWSVYYALEIAIVALFGVYVAWRVSIVYANRRRRRGTQYAVRFARLGNATLHAIPPCGSLPACRCLVNGLCITALTSRNWLSRVQDMTMVVIDIVSLLGMTVSLVFTIITMIVARDGAGRTDDGAHYKIYDAIESADIRVFLPHKQNASESFREVIQEVLSISLLLISMWFLVTETRPIYACCHDILVCTYMVFDTGGCQLNSSGRHNGDRP